MTACAFASLLLKAHIRIYLSLINEDYFMTIDVVLINQKFSHCRSKGCNLSTLFEPLEEPQSISFKST